MTAQDLGAVKGRRNELVRELRELAEQELHARAELLLKRDPKFKELSRMQREAKTKLWRKRVVAKRKAFALKVREERLAAIPLEIQAIEKDKAGVDREVQVLEKEFQRVESAITALKDQLVTAAREQMVAMATR